MSDTFLEVEDLSVTFRPRRGSETRPLRGVSFRVQRGSVTGLIGETGCGKSLTGRAVLGVLPAGASASGVVTVGGRSVLPVPRQEPPVPARLALVPQNPGANLNPVVPIGTQLSLIAHRHHQGSRRELAGFVDAELRAVGLDDVARVRRAYPHQLSGGMQQRVAIAAALVSRPDLVVADEPTTALDVTVEQQVLQVLRDRQQALGLTVLLITHDMGVVSRTCDHVCVLYAGRVVEDGPTAAVLEHPLHPYTARLLAARPAGTPRATALTTIPGSVPNDLRNVVGCAFAPRCPRAEPDCTAGAVDLVERGPQHHAECLHPLVETT